MQPTADKDYCNVLAMQAGLDPAGHAGHFDDAILIETPLPWKRELYEKAGTLPQEMLDLLARWLAAYKAGQPYNHRPLLLAPDPAYSQAGYRRILFFSRATGAFAHYQKVAYLVPEAEGGPLIWALYEAQERLPAFEQYRTPDQDSVRDLLVCTHGTIDVACAKFGYPLYRHLRDNYANDTTKVWRVSHFGGHVFAPTMMEMPTGHYWAYVEEKQAGQIVQRRGEVTALRGHYRGWSGLGRTFMQVAERELWQREGWAWFDYTKEGEILDQDPNEEDPQWAKVRITYTSPTGTVGAYIAFVEVTHTVETKPSTDHDKQNTYPQYTVNVLKHEAAAPLRERAIALAA